MPASVGVDVGGTKVLGVAVDAEGAVLAEERAPTPAGGAAVVAAVVDVVERLRAVVGPVVALGAGVPGLVDRRGVLRVAPNLPGVVELPVAEMLTAATGLPVRVDNDATCALWAEHRLGAARSRPDVVLVTLGTGIGGGILSGGRLLRGAHGFAGELGHMVVVAEGLPCGCGRRGCWEQYASGNALGRMGRDAVGLGRARRLVELAGGDPAAVRGEHVMAAAGEGDPEGEALVEELATWFGLGLANLVHVLDVDSCLVAGGLVGAGDVLLDPVRRSFAERVVAPGHRPPVSILAAELGPRAGAVGAALLAVEGRQPAPST